MTANNSRTTITISSQQEVNTTMPMVVVAISIMINRTAMHSNNRKQLVHLTLVAFEDEYCKYES
jgi:hypothetical protein